MARTHYTVTFPAARPGDEVTWPNTVKIYPDANTPVPLQSGQTLNESLAFSGWSESASIVFTRPAGDNDTVTVTSGSPSGTGTAVSGGGTGGSAQVGQFADQGAFALAVTLSDGTEYVFAGTDVDPESSTFTPSSGNLLTMDSDGNVNLPAGTYYTSLHGWAQYEVAPDSSVFFGMSVYLVGDTDAHGLLLRSASSNPAGDPFEHLTHAVTWNPQVSGDGSATGCSVDAEFVFILGKPFTLHVGYISVGADAQLVEAEIQIAALA